MTKSNIMEIIKENNGNKFIKWQVIENTKDLIVITNTYDVAIRFEIQLNADDRGDSRL